MIVIDSRWSGKHGIARFAGEVLDRLHLPARRLVAGPSPSSPTDLLNLERLRLGRGDLVYSPGFNVGVTRAKQLLTLHDLIHLDEAAERSRVKTLYYELFVRTAVRRAGAVLTVSPTSKRRIERWLGDAEVEVIDVGNGCSPVFLDREDTPPPRDGAFLYVGNLKPHKNVPVLFAALAERPGYRLTVATRDVDGVVELARRYGVEGRTRTVADVSDAALAELYAEHDALLMPSRLEGFGLPALEALAVGRRVGYSASCSSVADIVGVDGVAVHDVHDAAAWATAMDRLLADGPSARSADPAWRSRYSWDTVADRVRTAITALAA